MAEIELKSDSAQATDVGEKPRRFALAAFDRKFLLIALATLLAVRLLAVFWLPFTDTTEARYVEIARKMIETGDWITPQFDYGVPFWGKPPLHTWLSAIGMKIFGVGPFGGRILILATALGVLALIYTWVRAHRDRDQALVAVAVLASSIMFFGASAFVMTDMAMVLGTTLSMVSFYNCLMGKSSRTIWGRLFFVGIAIGLLAKGPVALVITGIPLVPWLAFVGRWRKLSTLPWVSGIAIAAVLTLPWYIAAEIKTPGFLRYFIIGEHFERFVVSGWQGELYGSGHARAKGMIWVYWIATFLPWTGFALMLLVRPKALHNVVRSDDAGWFSYLALWSIAPMLLFTPAANILAAYALPGLPATAVLLVTLWASARGTPGRRTRGFVGAALGGIAILFLAVTFMSQFAPTSLGLKTTRELVAAAQRNDPDVAFTFWGRRLYSAEFYTAGQVTFATESAEFAALVTNDLHDAVAIRDWNEAQAAPMLPPAFERIGVFGHYVLFIENRNLGDAS